ncbi:MAG: amidase domain-containing protein [Clostridiaceae bacterium]
MKAFKFIILTSIFLLISSINAYSLEDSEIEEIKNALEIIYIERNNMFTQGNITDLPQFFNSKSRYGGWALDHEVRRIKYLRKWAEERGIEFKNISSELHFRKITGSSDKAKVLANEYYKFTYVYKDNREKENVFGVGLIHNVDLIKQDYQWIINWDWYTDCFEDALKSISAEIKNLDTPIDKAYTLPIESRISINELPDSDEALRRKKAVAYADKYCGIPWASGFEDRYNKKYKNYTGAGGNCTNFVSQCLGDKEEGAALKQWGGWHSTKTSYGQSEGSASWVNADAFKNYLLYSGKGTLIKKGAYKDLISVDSSGNSIFSKLSYGDVICYSKGGDIDHFAIVTGFDSNGYPLINSHTTDRYKVPFDLGWGNKNIGFYFIKINY